MSRESSDASSQIESLISSSPFFECVSDIRTIISQLIRITIAIRKSSNRARFQKIDKCCDDTDFQPFRKSLATKIFRASKDAKDIEDQRKMSAFDLMKHSLDPSRLSPVQQRLVRTNVLRRNRFEHFKRKSSKDYSAEAVADVKPGFGQDGLTMPLLKVHWT